MVLEANDSTADGAALLSALPRRLRHVIEEGEVCGLVSLVCAEPGMGKLSVARRIRRLWDRQGVRICHEDYQGLSNQQATESMCALADALGQSQGNEPVTVVLLEHLPASDEYEVDRQAEALRRMSELGCFVVGFMLPEAEQLAEALPHALCLRCADLLVDGDSAHRSLARSLTHGIPALVDALDEVGSDSSPSSDEVLASPAYGTELVRLVASSLRYGLTRDDRRLRLAMLLLGIGSFDELALLVPSPDDGLLSWMEHEVPLYGIDSLHGTFNCVGISTSCGLSFCCDALASSCAEMSDLTAGAVSLLAARGDWRRAAMVCELCDSEDRVRLACEWGVEFVCSGEDSLVRRAFEELRRGDMPAEPSYELSAIALSALADPIAQVRSHATWEDMPGELTERQRRRRRHLELLLACRRLDGGVADPPLSAMREDEGDELAEALLVHMRARRLLITGRSVEAHALLLDNAARRDPDTLPGALLCDDYEMARMLIGEGATEDDVRSHVRAGETFGRLQSARLRRYHDVLSDLMEVFAARSKNPDLGSAISCAERMGDHAVRAILYVAASIGDVRAGTYESAHVHAIYAYDLARMCSMAPVAHAALLIDALVQAHCGDDRCLRELAASGEARMEGDLATLALTRPGPHESLPRLRCLSRSSNPRDALFLLNVLFNDFESDGLSQAFRENVPQAWLALSRVAVGKAEQFLRLTDGASGTQGALPDARAAWSRGSVRQPVRAAAVAVGEPRLQLRLLGGFDLRLDGRSIVSRLNRRMVKPYLILLGAAQAHELSMFEIMESLWPGIDLASGRQRIYNANCELRRAVEYRAHGRDPLVNNRGEGTVRLDSSVIEVDLDAITRMTRESLQAATDDRAVMGNAVRLAARYAGDIVATHYDACGLVRARREELRALFVDVMVLGAEASLREGHLSQAVRLAHRAYELDDVREDVVTALVEALKGAGRSQEACTLYDDYADRLLRREGKPPSRRLRRMVEGIYHVAAWRGGQRDPSERRVSLNLS